MNLGENLKSIRMSKGLSLRALALKSGVSKSTITEIENNTIARNPTNNTLIKLAEALEIETTELYDKEKEDSELKSFTEKLVKQLLDENLIKDPNDIPKEITDLIVAALKMDMNSKKR